MVCQNQYPGNRRAVAVMLSVFGDESADETKQRVFAVAGVIGSEKLWEPLEAKWKARTGTIPFHAKDCDSDQGEYANIPHDENKNLYRDLAIMLSESGLGGSGCVIDLIAQRRVFPEAPDITYYKCFLEVVQSMKNCAAFNKETVRFTFDMRRESEYNTGILYNMAVHIPEWGQYIFSSIAFECSPKHTRLQIADLFAREAMKAWDNTIGPIKRPMRKSWKALYDTKRFHVEVLSDDWFDGLKRDMPILEKETGMEQQGYRRWLSDNKLQDNTTNKFLYIQRLEELDRKQRVSQGNTKS